MLISCQNFFPPITSPIGTKRRSAGCNRGEKQVFSILWLFSCFHVSRLPMFNKGADQKELNRSLEEATYRDAPTQRCVNGHRNDI